MIDVWLLMLVVCQAVTEQFESAPMRKAHEQRQPHIGHRGFGMDKRLQTKRENDCRSPADALSANP